MTAATITSPEPTQLRAAFGAFPTGVTALAAVVDGEPAALVASSFTSVSLDPPIASVCVAHSSTTWPRLQEASRIGVSVLGEGQGEIARQLAAPGIDRFDSLTWRVTDDGAVLLDGSSAWLDCSIDVQIAAGDHNIVLLAVHALGVDDAVPPLVFHGSEFRRLAG
jgi:flavin reductase (DIM6/NTAB) family NADH-FMN oxidoreductase RutF